MVIFVDVPCYKDMDGGVGLRSEKGRNTFGGIAGITFPKSGYGPDIVDA